MPVQSNNPVPVFEKDSRSAESPCHSLFDVAIIGLSGRFPKAENTDALWKNLHDGIEGISFFSGEELLDNGVDPEVLRLPNYVNAGGVLDGIDLFDLEFFGFTPRDAAMVDPQHRLLLECAWAALEDAGYVPGTYKGRIGVFAGCALNNYLAWTGVKDLDLAQALIATDKDFLSTRVSYKLNLRGPSLTVQTACSTSLVAVHLAWQNLLAGSCDMALAGGASIVLLNKCGYLHVESGIASPDGHCRAFDAQSAGTVFGDGVGIVVLKRMSDALRDGDRIRAVIKGSAINNDGAVKVGYTAPSVEGQASVISQALAAAGLSPESISYIETHGTGTALGDPIEIAALTQAYQGSTAKKQFCAIGSVKTNVGHLNIAAGVTGLITTVLAMENQQLPPTLHFQSPNPKIDFQNSPFYVNSSLVRWEGPRPLRAGVSSFGIGGTNAHVIVEEPPLVSRARTAQPAYVVPFSARTPAALESMPGRLAEHLRAHPNLDIADVAYTLQVGREGFLHRRTLVCRNTEEMLQLLESSEASPAFPSGRIARRRSVVFMFSGQGSQYPNMAHELYLNGPVFRQEVDICAEALSKPLGCDIRELLFGRGKDTAPQLDDTWIAQPALFVTEYALAKQWMAWGVRPSAMIGHSIGEFVAACLAGVCSLEEALALVAVRGCLMQSLPAGYMLAIYEDGPQVRSLLAGLDVAAVNSPASCVVSGRQDRMDALAHKLAECGIDYRRLRTSHAFHSEMMDPILAAFIEQVRRVRLQAPRIPYISNVTGDWTTPELCTDPAYWTAHLRRTVLFSAGIERLLQRPDQVLLEVGPGRSLAALVNQHDVANRGAIVLASLRDSSAQINEYEAMLRALGRMWAAGLDVEWPAFHAGKSCYRVPLPTYPFERKRCWLTASSGDQAAPLRLHKETASAVGTLSQDESSNTDKDTVAASLEPASSAAEEPLACTVPLTPIQKWFFQQEFVRPHHWNMAVLLDMQEELTAMILGEALHHLQQHHDALRLRFARYGGEWCQVNARRLHDVLTTVSLPGDDGPKLVQQHVAEAQASLNLTSGPMFRAVQFTFGPSHPSQLLLVCHHLAVDITSWRILIEDLDTACAQLLQGRPVDLPKVTTSFPKWAHQLFEYRISTAVQEQLPVWLSRFAEQTFPQFGSTSGPNTVASARTISVSLDVRETQALIQVTRKHDARLSEVVLALVAESICRWSGTSCVLIDVESHGRESVFEHLDLSRTVGWLTSIFPVVVRMQGSDNGVTALDQVKQNLRSVHDGGLGYGLLRYLNGPAGEPSLARLPNAQICFNFLGRQESHANMTSLVHLRNMKPGAEQAPSNHRPYSIEINSWVRDGRLQISCGYSKSTFSRAEIARLSDQYRDALRAITIGSRTTCPNRRPLNPARD